MKALLPKLEGADDFVTALMTPAPTEKEKDRTLLERYLLQYTSRNTMDYFIHKDLGGFLRRELDFYIKNEVMRLDDIESADAPRVEAYLAKVKVLRRIAQHLIDFLAQLEDFQKRLWLKKKFVVDTSTASRSIGSRRSSIRRLRRMKLSGKSGFGFLQSMFWMNTRPR